MSFFSKQFDGNGGEKIVWSTNSAKEGAIHSFYVQNITAYDKYFDILINGVTAMSRIKVSADSYVAMEKPINIAASSVVSMVADTGLKALFSIFESVVDANAATNAVQLLVNQASAYATDAMEAAQNAVDAVTSILPQGAVADASISNTTTWSSTKINQQIALGAVIDCGNASLPQDTTIDGGNA